MKFSIKLLLPFLLLCLAFSDLPAWGEDDAVARALGLDGNSEASIRPGPRSPRPASLIAENVTVVSADDIARLNAHTLDEVLQTVSGIQLFQVRTPGSSALFNLNGSLGNLVLLLIDGVPQNLLGVDVSVEPGMIPVQRIERIEIIKGAASVSWGSALGGVVNVITRDPNTGNKLGGIASATYGESTTSDLRGGVSGTIDRFGYYLDGGKFHSNGLLPQNQVTLDHVFGKLTYDLPTKGRLTFAADFRDGDRGYGYGHSGLGSFDQIIKGGSRYASAYLRLDYPLRDRLNLEFLTSTGQKEIWQKWDMISPATLMIFDAQNRTDSQQASAKLTWGDLNTNLTAGFEYMQDSIHITEPLNGLPFLNFTRNLDRYGVYLNGAYSLGPVTLIPGVRFDQIGNNEQISSYHLGATWRLAETTLLRAYAARGYSLPLPNYHDSLQNIWTVQTGIESSLIPFLWLKGTLFYSNTWNIANWMVPLDYPFSPASVTMSEEIRQGFEIEGRTSTWYDLSLAAGFTYNDVWDKKNDASSKLAPLSITKFSLQYVNAEFGLRALLAGSHVNWPSNAGNSVHDRQIVWDLHLSQKLPVQRGVTPELFFSGRNLFNNAQYVDDFRTNAPCWFDGGVRFKF